MMPNTNEKDTGIIGRFSVALGLFDYINPILYSITVITIALHLGPQMQRLTLAVFLIGALLSLVFGLSIPTVKLIVGLGKMSFKMPVNLVSFVNTGILLSGLALISHVLHWSAGLLLAIVAAFALVALLIWKKTGKFNTVAVLIGALGYLMIYASLIALSAQATLWICVVFYALAIVLFVFLVCVGIFANLKNANVHWVIEICNVICQASVALATVLLFCR